jgi:hypothetical protein
VDTRRKKKKRTSKKNVDGRCTNSHENETFRSRSVVKKKGMVFGFRKTATPVVGPEIDRFEYCLHWQFEVDQRSLQRAVLATYLWTFI